MDWWEAFVEIDWEFSRRARSPAIETCVRSERHFVLLAFVAPATSTREVHSDCCQAIGGIAKALQTLHPKLVGHSKEQVGGRPG
jgi:hypothetical protein